jgi:RimJ/RimL family protein N-acetyltransferase
MNRIAMSTNTPSILIPIRSLGENHLERITRHLLLLEPHDRYLRFGFSANDDQIKRYAHSLNFSRDDIFGIYNRRLELIAMAHLAFTTDESMASCAEFGVSVSAQARGRGYGSRLFDRAVMHARNEGVSRLFIHALSENTAMLKIARHAGALVERSGSESEAHLFLLPATADTRFNELLQEQMAQSNYRVKVQIMKFWSLLTELQALRKDVLNAQDRCSK